MSIGVVGVGTVGKGIVQTLAQSEMGSSIVLKGRTAE